jgi:20S proteasome subunit alpha 3
MPIEQLIQKICDMKQSYTQFGGLRPFGVSILFAGWDRHHGFQLYQSDPSGNYGGWKAQAVGANNKSAQTILKEEYKEDINLQTALKLSVKVLSKTMDTTDPQADKIEISTITRNAAGQVIYRVLAAKELESLLKDVTDEIKAEKKKQDAKEMGSDI